MEKERAIQILNELIDKINQDDFSLETWKTICCNSIENIFVISKDTKKKQVEDIYTYVTLIQYPKTPEDRQENKNRQQIGLKNAQKAAENLILSYIKDIEKFGLEENTISKKLTEQLETVKKEIELLNKEVQKQKEAFELEISRINKTYKNQLDEANQKTAKLENDKVELERQINKLTSENTILLNKPLWQKYKSDIFFWIALITLLVASFQLGNNLGYDKGTMKLDREKIELSKKVDSLEIEKKQLKSENKQLKISFDSLKKLNTDKK